MSAGLRGNGVVAVLREAKSKWERRAALTPDHVSTLVKSGVRVLVQPCESSTLPPSFVCDVVARHSPRVYRLAVRRCRSGFAGRRVSRQRDPGCEGGTD